MAYDKGSRPEGGFKRRGPARRRKKVCVFCGKENNEIDYKDVARQDSSEKNHRKLCKASESSYRSNQESKTHCFNAIRTGLIKSTDRHCIVAAAVFLRNRKACSLYTKRIVKLLTILLTYVH